MADETIGGIRIPIEADFSDLGPEMDAAISQAREKADAIASAITEALSDIKTDGIASAFMKLGENAAVGAEGVDQLANRMKELIDSGEAASQNDALVQALKEMGDAAQAAVQKLEAVAAAQKSAGDSAAQAAGGQKAFSEGAQAVIDKQAQLDENLRQAIGVLSEIQTAFQQGAVSADTLAQAEKGVDDALRAASPGLESVKNNVKETGDEVKSAADRFAEFGTAMAALAGAFAFTEKLKEMGMAAIEAADHVDDATKALAMLTGSASGAEETVGQLRQIASDDAISFPNLLIASQRMTAFLGSSEQVPAIMRAAADAAQVMGTNVETASKAIERFAAGGDLSVKSLKQLGLTMADMAAALGTTEDKAKAAFAALDQAGKVDAVVTALQKFKGAAKEANDDALGALDRMGKEWTRTLEEIGKALDPVIKALADFARSNILEPIRNLVEAFNQLPAPVKDFAVAIGIAAAAIVPIAAGVASFALALPAMKNALILVQGALADVAADVAVFSVGLSELLIPIAAVGAAIALLHFTGLDEDIMSFVSGPLAALKEAFSIAAETIKTSFSELKANLGEFFESAGGFFHDLGPLIKDAVELSWKPFVDIVKQAGEAFGIVTPEAIKFGDVVKFALDLTAPVMALDVLNKSLKGLKEILDTVRPAIQLFSADAGVMKQATADVGVALGQYNKLVKESQEVTADLAMRASASGAAISQYGAGLKTLQEQQEKANEAVRQAKGVLDLAKSAYDGTAESQQVLNRATADYEKAVKAATAQTDAMKESSKAAKDAAKELAAEWKTANDDIQKFNDIASKVPQTFEDFTRAVEDGGKSAIQLLKDVDAAESKLYDDSAKLKGAPLDAVLSLIKGFEDLKTRLTDFADASEFQKIQDQVGALDAKFGGLKTDTLNMFNGLLDQLSAIPGAVAKNGQALLDWLKQAADLDKKLEDQQTKTQAAFDKAYLKYLSDSKQVVPVTASIVEELGHVDTTLQGIAANGGKAWDANPVAQYFAAVQDLNKAGITTLQQQEAQIGNLQNLAAEAAKINIPLGEQLGLQSQILQGYIKIGEETGASADTAVLALEKVRLKQEELRLSAHGYADEVVKGIGDILSGFDALGKAMADAIVDGKNVGDALVGVFKNIAKSILEDVIAAALIPLKKALIELIMSFLPSFGGALSTIGGGLGAMNAAAGQAAAGLQELATAATDAAAQIQAASANAGDTSGGSGGGGLASTVGAIGAVVSAGAAVASAILLAHISSDTGHIEVNTRECEAELLNVRADLWSQFGQMYGRLGEVMNDTHAMNDTLKQILASGANGGFPSQALNDLDNIAHDIHDLDMRFPNVQGALETVARDIVALGTLLYDPLDIIRQRIGQLLTAVMGGNALLGDLPNSGDIAAAASAVADAVNTGADSTSESMQSAAHAIGATVIDTNRQSTSLIDTRLAAVVSAAQAQYRAATDSTAQIAAMRAEYQADVDAMIQAQKEGNLDLAEQYRIAAGQVNQSIMQQMNFDQQGYANIQQTVTAGASTMAFAAQGAGVLVAAHVDGAAAAISAAVTAAAKAPPASFNPTGSGTTINVPPAGTQGGPVTSGSNPGVPVGTQPGFGGGTPKQPTNAAPPGPVITNPPGTYDPNLPDPTKPKAPYVPPVDTTSPYSSYYQPPSAPAVPPLKGGPTLPSAGAAAETPPAAATPDAVSIAMTKLQADQASIADLMQKLAAASAEQKPLLQQQIDLAQKQVDIDTQNLMLAKQQAAVNAELAKAQAALQDALKNLGSATDDQQKADIQKQIDGLLKTISDDQAKLATIQQAMTGGTSASAGVPPLKGGPTLPGAGSQSQGTTPPANAPAPGPFTNQALIDQTQTMIDQLKAQLVDATKAGNTDLVSQLTERLQVMQERMALLQRQNNAGAPGTTGTEQTNTGTSTSATTTSTGGQPTLDAETRGFYAGTLAELEDIRVQAHAIKDVSISFRDGLVAIGKRLLELSAGNGGKPKADKSFDEGGPVSFDMIGQLHEGEEVLPRDVASALRSMLRQPNYGQLRTPTYSDTGSAPARIVQITAPVTVLARDDPRQQAEKFVSHLKKVVPDAGAFSS